MVTEHVALPVLRVAMTVALSKGEFEKTPVELLKSNTLASTEHIMAVVDGIADETVMVELVTILPEATDTSAGLPIGCIYIGRNELLLEFRYPGISGPEPSLAPWLQAVPASVVAKTRRKMTFDS